MPVYKIFRKNPARLKTLKSMNENSELTVCRLLHCDDAFIGYNEEGDMFLEMAQCPRLYVGMLLDLRNAETNVVETLGELVDIQHDESMGYLLIMQYGKEGEAEEPI